MRRKRARATSTALDGCAWGPGVCVVRSVFNNRVWRSFGDEGCVDCVEITCQSQETAEARVLTTLRFQGQLEFPSRLVVGRFAVAMETIGDMQTRLIILDAMLANVMKTVRMPIHLCKVQYRDAVVDSRATTCVLMLCNGSVWAWQESLNLTSDDDVEGKWTELGVSEQPAKVDLRRYSSTSGIFISTPVLASCFALTRTTLDTQHSIIFERIIYDFDSGWTPISDIRVKKSLDSRMAMDIDSNSHFFASHSGNQFVIARKSVILCFSMDLVDENEDLYFLAYDFEGKFITATWKPPTCDIQNDGIGDMDVLTILLSNGQLLDISLGVPSSLVPVEIQETLKMINQVVWIDTQENPKLLVFEESNQALLTIENVAEIQPTSSSISFDMRWSMQPNSVDSLDILWKSHRFWLHNKIQTSTQSLEDVLQRYCESSSQKNRHGLLNVLRLFLGQSSEDFVHDIVFTLLSIIHHQGMSVIETDAASPAAAIFLDLLVTRIVSIDCCDRTQFVGCLMAAPPAFSSRNARRFYYRKPLSCLYRRVLKDENRQQDYISAVNAFLDMYSPAILSLAHQISVMEAEEFELAMKQCKHICKLLISDNTKILLEETESFKRKMTHIHNCDDEYSEILIDIILSYSMVCSNLYIDGVAINLPQLLILLRSNGEFSSESNFRKEFLIPLLRVLDIDVSADNDTKDRASTSASSNQWSIQHALQLAIDTRTAQILFAFCVESESTFANDCIQKLTEEYELLIMKNMDSSHDRMIHDLEMSICEMYLSEMIAILQHLPIVQEFQHPAPYESNVEAKFIIELAWELFLKDISTGLEDGQTHNHVKTESELVFSSSELYWQHRMMRLKMSVMWHLQRRSDRARRGNHNELPDFLVRVFLLEFLQDALKNPDDTKLIQKFLIKSQDALACSTSRASLIERLSASIKRDSRNTCSEFIDQIGFRFEKLLRSIAAIMWSMWVRERCAYCFRFLELIKEANGSLLHPDVLGNEIGNMAATCALQLNTVGLVTGKVDQISYIQTLLLEDAAKLCPRKVAAVFGWGFPTDKINARYLKRYKAIKHLLKNEMEANKSTDCENLEEIENRCQFIQNRVKRKIRDFIANGKYQRGSSVTMNPMVNSPKGSEVKRRWAMDIDVLVDCCCTLEFQLLVWALFRKEFPGYESSAEITVSPTISASTPKKQANQQVRLTPSLRMKDTGMSRDEILALLRKQQQEFDARVQLLLSSRKTELPKIDNKEKPKTSPQREDESILLADKSQLTSKFRSLTRELSPRHQSFPDLDAERRKEMNINQAMLQRGQSVQNVLKLLQLRKITDETVADPRQIVGHLFANTTIKTTATRDSCDHKNEVTETKASKSLNRARQSTRSSVFALRFEEDVNGAHLKLLRCGNGKPHTVKLRSKHFEAALPTRSCTTSIQHEDDTNENRNYDVVKLCMASVQTDTIPVSSCNVKSVTWADTSTNPCPCEKSMGINDDKEITYKKGDLNKQMSAVQGNHGSFSIATQCNMNTPQTHKMTQVKAKSKSTAVPSVSCAFHKLSIHVQLNDKRRKKFMQVMQSTGPRPFTSSEFDDLDDEEDSKVVMDNPQEQKTESDKNPNGKKDVKKEEHSVNEESTSRMLKYQAKYRERVSLHNGSKSEKKNGNANAFAGLHDDMKRMKQRLNDLEQFADAIDENYRDSHHKLLRMGDSQDHTKVLETIDSVLRETSEYETRVVDRPSDPSASTILERKVTSDMVAAKNLLAKIERLAPVDNDDTG